MVYEALVLLTISLEIATGRRTAPTWRGDCRRDGAFFQLVILVTRTRSLIGSAMVLPFSGLVVSLGLSESKPALTMTSTRKLDCEMRIPGQLLEENSLMLPLRDKNRRDPSTP